MKWTKTCSRSTTPEERFSDLPVNRHVLLWVIRGRRDLSCQSVWLSRRVKKETKIYRCCTVLLVLNNTVSNLTNLYLWNQNIENLRIQTLYPPNPPSPTPLALGCLPRTLILATPSLKKSWIRPCRPYAPGWNPLIFEWIFFPLKLKRVTLWQHLLIRHWVSQFVESKSTYDSLV